MTIIIIIIMIMIPVSQQVSPTRMLLQEGIWVFITGGCSGRGVQWMGVVLYNKLVYNTIQFTTPCFHCTPLWWILNHELVQWRKGEFSTRAIITNFTSGTELYRTAVWPILLPATNNNDNNNDTNNDTNNNNTNIKGQIMIIMHWL